MTRKQEVLGQASKKHKRVVLEFPFDSHKFRVVKRECAMERKGEERMKEWLKNWEKVESLESSK